MLTKEQATQLGDALLAHARPDESRFPGAASTPVPMIYRCRDLRPMPNGVQVEVVRQAKDEVLRNPLFIGFCFACFLALGAIWIFTPSLAESSGMAMPLIMLCWIVPLGVRTVLVRRSIKSIAAQLQQAWRSPAPD